MSKPFGKGFRQPSMPTKNEVMDENTRLVDEALPKLANLDAQVKLMGNMLSQMFQAYKQLQPEVSALGALTAATTVDRPAKENDYVMIDYLGVLLDDAGNEAKTELGLPDYFEGGYGSKFVILGLGGGTLVPGFEEQLIGKSAGERVEVKLTFPKDYQAKPLASKAALFHVVVQRVMEPLARSVVDQMKMENEIAKGKAKQEKVMSEAKTKLELVKTETAVVADAEIVATPSEAVPSVQLDSSETSTANE